MYCIPNKATWKVVLNTNLYSWGLHADTTKDFAKIEVPVEKPMRETEYFTMVFEKASGGANLVMAWDDVKTILPINFR
jgi:hypothetical protein